MQILRPYRYLHLHRQGGRCQCPMTLLICLTYLALMWVLVTLSGPDLLPVHTKLSHKVELLSWSNYGAHTSSAKELLDETEMSCPELLLSMRQGRRRYPPLMPGGQHKQDVKTVDSEGSESDAATDVRIYNDSFSSYKRTNLTRSNMAVSNLPPTQALILRHSGLSPTLLADKNWIDAGSLNRTSGVETPIKTVLLWSAKFYSNLDWMAKSGGSCLTGRHQCRYITDRSRVWHADVVVLHLSGSYNSLVDLVGLASVSHNSTTRANMSYDPLSVTSLDTMGGGAKMSHDPAGGTNWSHDQVSRDPQQVWIAYNKEPPIHSQSLSTAFLVNKLRGLINYTANYSPDADIVNAYGECMHVSQLESGGEFENTAFAKHYLKVIREYRETHFKVTAGKSKMVAWFVSHCHTWSKRERYVEELSKYIAVDVYGKCGASGTRLRCPSSEQYCGQFLASVLNQYKFYLSFENSFCEEYITEKAFKVLTPNTFVVPVVLGHATYHQILPPSSYIDVRNFTSPRALAAYLHYLDRNGEAYGAYFDWRKHYVCDTVAMRCRICDVIHQVAMSGSHVTTTLDTFLKDRHCISPAQFYQGIADIT